MRIEEIHIQNFKGFSDVTFRLNKNFTVFIGENASGKTSVLDTIAIAAGSFFVGIDGVSPRNIQEREIRVATIDGQPKPQKPLVIQAKGMLPGKQELITWSRTIVGKKTTHKDAKNLIKIASDMHANSRKRSGVLFPAIVYFSTGRLWAEHEKIGFQKQTEGVVAAYTNALSAKSSSKEFLSWFKTQEDAVQKFGQPLDIAHLKAMKSTILRLIPDERWQDLAFDHKTGDLVGIFTDSDGKKNKLAYNQLSDGFRNIVGIAADIAYRCIQLNPHLGERAVLDTPGIVLIDELDLHLHPNWQRRVVEDLKRTFPLLQFVATTHSPFIVQSLKTDELINLDRITDVNLQRLSIEEIATSVMGAEAVFSRENHQQESISQQYLDILEKQNGSQPKHLAQDLDALEQKISDPAVRAFLQMQRLKKNTGNA